MLDDATRKVMVKITIASHCTRPYGNINRYFTRRLCRTRMRVLIVNVIQHDRDFWTFENANGFSAAGFGTRARVYVVVGDFKRLQQIRNPPIYNYSFDPDVFRYNVHDDCL